VVGTAGDPAQAPQLTDPLLGNALRPRRRTRPTTFVAGHQRKVAHPPALSSIETSLCQRPQCNTSQGFPGPGVTTRCLVSAVGAPASARLARLLILWHQGGMAKQASQAMASHLKDLALKRLCYWTRGPSAGEVGALPLLRHAQHRQSRPCSNKAHGGDAQCRQLARPHRRAAARLLPAIARVAITA